MHLYDQCYRVSDDKGFTTFSKAVSKLEYLNVPEPQFNQ